MRRCCLALLSLAFATACGGDPERSSAVDAGGSTATGGSAGAGSSPSSDASASSADAPGTGGSLAEAGQSAADRSAEAAGPQSFQHPGILLSLGQLDFVKNKIAANQDPWAREFKKAKATQFGRLPYTATPVVTMKCGTGANPFNQGCEDSRNDAVAAYTQSLIWYYTGDKAYATSAIAILDAWASQLKELVFDPAKVSSDPDQNNGPLQAAWLAEMFPRSAEILRHASSGWPESNAQKFGAMLTGVILPKIVDGWGYQANWNLSMANGMINIGVYNDDMSLFQQGVNRWRERVPFNMYLASDGPLPKSPPTLKTTQALVDLWYGQSIFTGRSGHTQETCRDFSHTQMGHASTIYAAETAGHQGVDLYGEEQTRIIAAFEYIAKYSNMFPSPNEEMSAVDATLCGGTLKTHDIPTWEVGYNHYAGRRGLALPESQKMLERLHAETGNSSPVTNVQIAWETLTHGDIGSAGFP